MRTLLSFVSAGFLMIGTATGRAETLRYNDYEPPGVVSIVEMTDFFKELSAETKGSLNGQIFFGGQLLGPAATLKGVGDRVVDGGFVLTVLSIGALSATNIPADLMFHVKDPWVSLAAALDTVLTDCPTCAAEAKAANIVWFGGPAPPPWNLMCRAPIASSDDLRGRKIRVTGASATRLASAFGMIPVQLPPTEIGAALQGGQIDCTAGPVQWLKDFGLVSTIKAVIDYPLGIANALGYYVFNRDAFNRYTPEQRQAILKLIPASAVRATGRYEDSSLSVRQDATKQGVEFLKPDQKFVDTMNTFVENEIPHVTADLKRRRVADPDSLIKAYLANVAKWEKIVAAGGGDRRKLTESIRAEIFAKLGR